MNDINDYDLIKKIAAGDSKAFESLLQRHGDLVFGISCKMLKDRIKAEDMTQTTWIKVLTEAKNYSPFGSVKSWILKINRNLIIDYFRSEKKWNLQDLDATEELPSLDEPPLDQLVNFEQKEIFNIEFEKLDERTRLVFTMVMVEEKSYVDIAKELNFSVGAVKTIIFRGKEFLASRLQINRGKND